MPSHFSYYSVLNYPSQETLAWVTPSSHWRIICFLYTWWRQFPTPAILAARNRACSDQLRGGGGLVTRSQRNAQGTWHTRQVLGLTHGLSWASPLLALHPALVPAGQSTWAQPVPSCALRSHGPDPHVLLPSSCCPGAHQFTFPVKINVPVQPDS